MPKILSESHSLFDKSTFSFYQGNIKMKFTISINNFSNPYYEEKNSKNKKIKQ
jgi:hypothetical protein